MSEVDVPEVRVSLSNVDVVEVGLSLSEVEVVDGGASLSLSDVEETDIVEDWSFRGAREDWSMETGTDELVIEKVSMEVWDRVKIESLSVSSAYTGCISKGCCGREVQKVAELIADDIQIVILVQRIGHK